MEQRLNCLPSHRTRGENSARGCRCAWATAFLLQLVCHRSYLGAWCYSVSTVVHHWVSVGAWNLDLVGIGPNMIPVRPLISISYIELSTALRGLQNLQLQRPLEETRAPSTERLRRNSNLKGYSDENSPSSGHQIEGRRLRGRSNWKW